MKQSKSFYKNLMAVLLTLAFGILALVFGVLFLKRTPLISGR